jgi:uncharacterized Zn-binding protein involved in type VI secretion
MKEARNMTGRKVIVLGDKTSHGGEVISASGEGRYTIDGIPVACVGDKVSCPIKGHGPETIIEGDEYSTLDGKPIALEGCKVSCGAVLISEGQSRTTHSNDFVADEKFLASLGAEAAAAWAGYNNQKPKPYADMFKGIQNDSSRRNTREEARPLKQQEKLPVYDEQVRLIYVDSYSGAEKHAENVEYELFSGSTGKVLTQGKTDSNGLTERFSTSQPEQLEVIVYRSNEGKKVGVCTTNNTDASVYDIHIPKGHLFFDIHYKVRDKAFSRAARTERINAVKYNRYKKENGDDWLSFEISTEADFKQAWSKIFAMQQELDMEIQEGHIYSHASLSFLGIAKTAGLEFRESPGEDGTLGFDEIFRLERLKWTKTSELHLYGCRSGRFDFKENRAAVDAFFERQASVKWVWGQTGYSFFSSNPNTFVPIEEDPNCQADVYLWAFWRKRNHKFPMPKARDGEKMPPYSQNR